MDPFHPGEIVVQERAQVRAMATRIGGGIRNHFPPAARDFVASQRTAYFSIADATGRLWTHLLNGDYGFLGVDEEENLLIFTDSLPQAREEAPVGVLLLESATRRRMRCNGILERTDLGWRVRPRQVYANCPKYIQARQIIGSSQGKPQAIASGTALNDEMSAWIENADTFFIGTRYGADVDCSHRGGLPGFVRLENGVLVWPDYVGNAMFNTLGNLESDPSCGLLFVDFKSGGTLQFTGEARVRWQGTEREVEFAPKSWRVTVNATPWRWSEAVPSPFNPPLG